METQGQTIIVHRDQWAPEHLALLCGIANAGGGIFILDSNSKSYTSGLRKMRRPFEQIPRLAEKALGLECPTEPVLDGSTLCLEVTIPPANHPIAHEGVYWLWSEGRNIQSTREAVLAALEEAAGGGHRRSAAEDAEPWEMRPQPLAQQRDINASEFLAIASLKTDTPDLPTDSVDIVFERRLAYLNLRHPQTQTLTNAGVLLLHNQPEQLIPGALVQLRLFAQGSQALLESEVCGPLGHQLAESLRLLFQQYLPMAAATPGHAEDTITTPAMPPQWVVRGMVLCALAHKDYECEQPLVLRVFPDRLLLDCPTQQRGPEAGEDERPSLAAGSENSIAGRGIASYGAVAIDEPLSMEAGADALGAANPILVNALRLMGVMDEQEQDFRHLGTRCTEAGMEPPSVQRGSNIITIVFPLHAGASSSNTETPPHAYFSDTEDIAPTADQPRKSAIAGLGSSVPKNAPFSVRSIAAANKLDLTSTDEYVLRVLHTNGRATAVRIANVLGVSESTVRRSFRKLREHGFIERVGSDKAGYWRVIE